MNGGIEYAKTQENASAFIAFLMAFALIFTSSGIGSLTFTKADDTQTIYYNGDQLLFQSMHYM